MKTDLMPAERRRGNEGVCEDSLCIGSVADSPGVFRRVGTKTCESGQKRVGRASGEE